MKKILSLCLVVVMLLCIVPMTMTGISAATAEQTIFVSNTGHPFAGGNWKAYSYYPYGDLWGANFAGLNNAGRADVDAEGQICVWNLAQTNGVFNCPTPITALSSTNTTTIDGFYFRNGNLAANGSGVIRYPEIVSYAFSQEEFSATLSPSTFTWTDGFAQASNCSIQNGLIITLIHSNNDLTNPVAVYDQIKAYVVKDGTVVSAQGFFTDNQGKDFGMVIGFSHEVCIRIDNGMLTYHMEAADKMGTYEQNYTFNTLDLSSLVDTKSYYFTMGVGSDDPGPSNTNGSANLNLARIGSFDYDAATNTYTMDSSNKNSADWTGNSAPDTPVPGTPVEGDVVVQGDYTYTYSNNNVLGAGAGWNVVATDKAQTSYGAIAAEINGEPVVAMAKTFDGCTAMTAAPTVPASIKVMYNTFKNCVNLTAAPTVPNGVTMLYGTFKNCVNLTSVGTIPATVTNMYGAFSGCTALTKAPAIPASVTNMTQTFRNCTKLKAAPNITNVAIITEAFDGCTALSGSVSFNSNYNAKAFRNTSVSAATIGASKIERSCFNNSYLKNVTYTGTAAQWLSLDVASGNAALKSANVVTSTVASAPSVTVKDGRTYICDIDGADVKDMFIAKGTQNSYQGVKSNTVVRFTSAKIGDSNIVTYGVALASGNYTLYVRNIDGTVQNVTFTVA